MVFTALPNFQIPVGRISFRARTLVVPRPLRRRQNPNPAGAFVGFPEVAWPSTAHTGSLDSGIGMPWVGNAAPRPSRSKPAF